MSEEQPAEEPPLLGMRMLAATAALAVLVFAALTGLLTPLAAAFTAYLFFTMALITVCDHRHFIVPDVLSLPAIPVGLIANAVVLTPEDWRSGFMDGLAGAAIGSGVFLALRLAYGRLRGVEGLGVGDVKLAGVAGAWLGTAALAPACLAAALGAMAAILLQALLGGGQKLAATSRIPFGSFIAPTIFAFWLIQMLVPVPLW
jgi:leader peptidase (prepilin peptidase)/N-methyltransferase